MHAFHSENTLKIKLRVSCVFSHITCLFFMNMHNLLEVNRPSGKAILQPQITMHSLAVLNKYVNYKNIYLFWTIVVLLTSTSSELESASPGGASLPSMPSSPPVTNSLVCCVKEDDFFGRGLLGNMKQINTRKSSLAQFFPTPNLQRLNSFPL